MSYDLEALRKQYDDLAEDKIFATLMPLDAEYVAGISLPVFKAILDALERVPELEQELIENEGVLKVLRRQRDEAERELRSRDDYLDALQEGYDELKHRAEALEMVSRHLAQAQDPHGQWLWDALDDLRTALAAFRTTRTIISKEEK